MAFCRNCGSPVDNNDDFCVHCGTRITAPQMPRKGVGLAITSLIVGIIGALIALEVFAFSFVVLAIPTIADGMETFLLCIPIYAMFSVISIILLAIARARGYSGRLRKVSFKMGVASLIALAIGALSFAFVLYW